MKKIVSLLILIILILVPVFSFATENASVQNAIELEKSSLNIYANNAILIEENTGDILYEKNAYEKLYPASTTKILTAILVLENCYLNEIVTVSQSALDAVPSGYTRAKLQANEQFSVQELLYIMLIPSANDAANVLAEHVAGSISAFADLMNKKAKEIGLINSHFTNPSGIHDENLYTTPYDLAILARYAMNIDLFKEIVKTTSYTVPSTSIHPAEDRILKNSNLLLDPNNKDYYYEYATGIKTGFTDEAGNCLVASAKKNDIEFIAVCLKEKSNQNGLREKFSDCKTLLDFAIRNYTTQYEILQEKNSEIENLNKNPEVENQSINLNIVNTNGENTSYSNFDIINFMSKIVAILIIILAIKLLFFSNRKN